MKNPDYNGFEGLSVFSVGDRYCRFIVKGLHDNSNMLYL